MKYPCFCIYGKRQPRFHMESVKDRLCVQLFTVLSLIICGVVDVFVVRVLQIPDWLGCFIHGVVLSMYVMENWALLTELRSSKTECVVMENHMKIIQDTTKENIRLEAEQTYLRNRLSDHLKLRQENTDLRSHHGRLKCIITELRSQLVNFKTNRQSPLYNKQTNPQKTPLKPQPLADNCIGCWRRRWNTHPDLRLFFHSESQDSKNINPSDQGGI